jgi:hypothetical protein
MPPFSSADAAIRAVIDLCWAIRNPTPASPLAPIGDAQMDAIQQLADIFAGATKSPPFLAALALYPQTPLATVAPKYNPTCYTTGRLRPCCHANWSPTGSE